MGRIVRVEEKRKEEKRTKELRRRKGEMEIERGKEKGIER
jgi:hypothetical protein